ncbi:hemolysin family protein [soil metagenome]
MSDLWLQVLLVLALISLNAAFAGSEIALISLRPAQIDRLEQEGGSARTLAHLARDPNRFLATIQIGITVAGFLASATAAVSLAQPLIEPLSFLGGFARPTAIFLVTLVLSFLTLVLGELAPKRVALQRSEVWGRAAARPLAVLARITSPFVWTLAKATDAVVRALGGDPSLQREEMTHEELRDIVSSRPGFHRVQRDIMSGAFEIAERTLREIVVPRPRVFALRSDLGAEEALDALLESGHSRCPVVGEGLDDVFGVVHLRDLIGKQGRARDHMREALALPETLHVLRALEEMQNKRQQMSIVIDEHGGTVGLVTIEDLLEELVGEIYDEFDRDVRNVVREEDGALILNGDFPIHDLPDLGVALSKGPYTTVGGWAVNRAGRVPSPGEVVHDQGWHIQVLDSSGISVNRVRLHRHRPT